MPKHLSPGARAPSALALFLGLLLAHGAAAVVLPGGGRAKPHPSSASGSAREQLLAGPFSPSIPRSGLQSAAAPTPLSPVHLSYYGGRVLAKAQLVAVFWGTPDPALRSRLDSWYANFVSGPAYDWLSEYSTTGLLSVSGAPGSNQTLGRATYGGSFILQAGASGTVGDSEVRAGLLIAINSGALPKPQPETLYVLHFAPSLTVSDSSGTACNDYCAYHDSFVSDGQTYLYAIIPSHAPPSGCATCGELDWYSNLGGSVSHEVVEAVTDPDVGAALRTNGPSWYDTAPSDAVTSHAEIGDICADSSLTGISEIPFGSGASQWAVQREWSNHYNACVASGDDGVALQADSLQLYAPGGSFDLPITATTPASGPVTLQLQLVGGGTGITASLSSSSVKSGGTVRLKVTTTAQAPSSFKLAVVGESGRASPVLVFVFGQTDFIVSTSRPVTLTAAGPPVTFSASTLNVIGPARPVQLTPVSQPGISATVSPGQLKVGDMFDLSLSAAAGTPSGLSNIQVNFNDGKAVHPIAVQLTVEGDDFAVATPAALSVKAGGDFTFTLQTQTTHGNPQPLKLAAAGLPNGSSATFSPSTVQSGQSAQVSVHLGDGAPLGPQRFSITAAGTLVSGGTEVSLNVAAGGCSSVGSAPWLAVLLPFFWRLRKRTGR